MKIKELFSKPINLIGGGILNLRGFNKSVINKDIPTSKEKELEEQIADLQNELNKANDRLKIRYIPETAEYPKMDFKITKDRNPVLFTKDICDIDYFLGKSILGEQYCDILIFSSHPEGVICYYSNYGSRNDTRLKWIFDENKQEDEISDYFSRSDIDDNINSLTVAIPYFNIGGSICLCIETDEDIESDDSIEVLLNKVKNSFWYISYQAVEL